MGGKCVEENKGCMKVEFFRNNNVENVLPKPPADYPDSLQGIIWMDQSGYYGYSDIPGGGLPDGAVSFGDSAYRLNTGRHSLYVNPQGPCWGWFNNKKACAMYKSGGESGYH